MRLFKSLLGILLLCVVFTTQAQYRAPRSASSGGNWEDKIYFGGGGGLSGGTDFLSVSLSPLMGYKITEEFSLGMQITYQYTRFGSFSASNYGGGPFALYAFTDKFFAYSQYEYLNVQPLIVGGGTADRLDFTSLFAGFGYNEPLGRTLSFQILALYNFLYGDGSNSPYQSPLQFRVGLVAGF